MSTPVCINGAVIMKITSSTSITSIIGVTLISEFSSSPSPPTFMPMTFVDSRR